MALADHGTRPRRRRETSAVLAPSAPFKSMDPAVEGVLPPSIQCTEDKENANVGGSARTWAHRSPTESDSPEVSNIAQTRVYVRVRPLQHRGSSNDSRRALVVEPHDEGDLHRIQLTLGSSGEGDAGTESCYCFHHVFEEEDHNELASTVGAPLVASVLNGYNGALLAYGQTGSGKTFTLGEPANIGTPSEGITARMLRQLYEEVVSVKDEFEYTLRAEYLQVYLEKIYDLLSESKEPPALAIREDKVRGVYAQGATSVEVKDLESALDVVQRGAGRLRFASTALNRHSSRSHAVFMLSLTRRPKRSTTSRASGGGDPDEHAGLFQEHSSDSLISSESSTAPTRDEGSAITNDPAALSHASVLRQQSVYDIQRALERAPETHAAILARLTIVDLAGSERVSRTGVSGVKLNEAQKINVSLLALGNVITALAKRSDVAQNAGTEGAGITTVPHIPFRDSHLTRLLQESLGGNCRTSVLVCASPALSDLEETKSALLFGTRAMRVVASSLRRNTVMDLSGLAQELQTKLEVAETKLLEAEKRYTLRGASEIRRSLRIRAEAADAAANASRDRVLLLEQMAAMQASVEMAEVAREQMRAIAEAAAARADEAEARADAAEAALAELHSGGFFLFSPAPSSATRSACQSRATLSPARARGLGEPSERRFQVVKHGLPWKGKYRRTLVVTSEGLQTLNPHNGYMTNRWSWDEIFDASPIVGKPTMVRLSVSRGDSLLGSMYGDSRLATPHDSLVNKWNENGRLMEETIFSPRTPVASATPTPAPASPLSSPVAHQPQVLSSPPFSAPAALVALKAREQDPDDGQTQPSLWRRLIPTAEMVFESDTTDSSDALLSQLRMGLACAANRSMTPRRALR